MKKKILTPKRPHNASLQAYAKAVKRGQDGLHVVKHTEGWAIKHIGSARVRAVCGTQREAEKQAVRIKKTNGGIVYVHGKDGSIQRVR